MATRKKKNSKIVPTLLGTLILLITTGLLLNVFIFGMKASNSETVHGATTETLTFRIKSDSDLANEDGQTFTQGASNLWIGTGGNTGNSYLGMRFTSDSPLPAGAQIVSASVDFVPKSDQWLNLSTSFYAETAVQPEQFSSSSRPSQRGKTDTSKSVSDNVKWVKDQHYQYDISSVLQSLPNSSNRSVISILAKGGSTTWGRKFLSGSPELSVTYRINTEPTATTVPTSQPTAIPTATRQPTRTPTATTAPIPTTGVATPQPTMPHSTSSGGTGKESMAMMGWAVGGKNAPNPTYDKCDDGTDVVAAHNQYYVIAYDGIKYPTWHPPVVTNPITGNGKCYFGHEHGTDPQKYLHWNEIVQHFGKDQNGDGIITPLVVNASNGLIVPGDRAGIPFGIANEHMDQYYNQEGRDSIFVRHEDHVGHKIEFVNKESDANTSIDGHQTASTHQMAQLSGTNGLNIPYYSTSGSNDYKPTGVVCTHLHKFHQGTHSGDGIKNNLHEVIFHSTCQSVNTNGINAPAYYPSNTVLLTGMMAFGKPGEYLRFCFADRSTKVCPDGKNANGSCVLNDPLLSKLPNAINSTSLGRNMVDRYCLENWKTLNPGNNYFGPYELWEGDLRIQKADGDMLAEHGRQWDVLDPIRFVDPKSPTGFSYNAMQCAKGGAFDNIQYIGGCASRTSNVAWNSPQSGFRGLKRTTYFGRNRVSNPGSTQIWWTDPLGGNAVPTSFSTGLKQRISTVEADIQRVQSRIQQLFGSNNFLNDRAIQRGFNDGGRTVHAPN